MFVKQVLPEACARLVTVGTDALVTKVATLLSGGHDLVVIAASDGTMAGVVTKTDLVRLLSNCHVDVCMVLASTAMTREVTYCRPADSLQDVWSLMKERGFRHIPIIDDGSRPVGVITAREALQATRKPYAACALIATSQQIAKPPDETMNGFDFVTAVEVDGTEIAVSHGVAKHVVAGGEHGCGHREDRFLCTASGFQAQELRTQ